MARGLGCGLLVLLLLPAGACGDGPTAPLPASLPAPASTYASAHFVFHYTVLDAANIAAIAAALESQHERILGDLDAGAMPPVHVTFYLDHAALENATRAVAGVVPSWSAGLVTARDQIHLMSPNLPAWAPYDRMIVNLVHEFAHCVSLQVNPRIANNPRWLWEAVAIYEAGQFVNPRTLAYMAARRPPSFAQLSSLDNTLVYDVGYLISEFVVTRWGQKGLRGLLLANGDSLGTVGLAQADFESQWFAFVTDRYGL